MDRRKFITTCACCVCAGGVFALLNEKRIDIETNGFVMYNVGVHLAEHCNLDCKYCSHFSSVAQEEFYDLDKYRQDMKQMSLVFNKQLFFLQLQGGEPLLNPNINEFIKASRKYFPNTRIGLTTNAILLNEMNESFWKTLNKNNVHLAPSIYPIKINWKSIIDKAKKYDVKIYPEKGRNLEDLRLKDIDEFQIKFFGKMTLNINGTNKDKKRCEPKLVCHTMHYGKLYPCSAIAFIKYLNKKFNTDFVVSEGDYLDLYKVKDVNEVKEFIEKPLYPFCKYCKKDLEKVKWENSPIHTLNEWT